ncbi:hypothetical protein NFI96_015327 [Prochilodus magdalenae]|nr:hypothetical protein NFI96_015327 [Prochilodus magdalenae]
MFWQFQRPSAAEGHTTFIATDRGHLLPGVKVQRGSTWTSFQGTWDLPNHIPPVHINPTARSLEGKMRIKSWGQSQRLILSATDKPQEGSRANSRTCNRVNTAHFHCGKFFSNYSNIVSNQSALFQKTDEEVQTPASIPVPDGQEPTAEKPSSQAQSRPETQQSQAPSRPVTQQSHAESRPASQQNMAETRPTSPQSQAQSRPVSPPAE